ERTQPDSLVDERPGDSLAQGRFGGIGEAAQHLIIGLDRFFAAVERTQPDSLVVERLGDSLAQGRFGGIAEAVQHLIIGLDLFLAAVERTQHYSDVIHCNRRIWLDFQYLAKLLQSIIKAQDSIKGDSQIK